MEKNLNLNHDSVDARFKDSTPTATVERIIALLASYGIETEETWHETSVPYCHAMSVRVKGTLFSTNGKGLTKEFARASGYGELMERLQIGSIYKGGMQKDGVQTLAMDSYCSVSMDELLKHEAWYDKMGQNLALYTGISMTGRQILMQHADSQGNVLTIPFYCLTTDTKEYFPADLRGKVYTTNGCAAGNSAEETLVQGLSEIVERHHMMRIIDGGYSLPEIPEEVLQRYDTAYSIIQYVRSQGYKVVVKDCSLGQKFPVVSVYIIDEATGRYHTHFGAYPKFEIALERSLTESFQGHNIRDIARFEDFLHKKPGEFSFASVSNELVLGTHTKTLSFFIGEPAFPFNPNVGFTGENNKDILRQCVQYFKDMGFDILVRNNSCLGFHTYQIVIPGYSETFVHRLANNLNEYRYAPQAMKALRNPSAAPLQDQLALLMHLEQMKKFTATIGGVKGFQSGARLSAQLSPQQDTFYMSATLAYIYYGMGKYPQAIQSISNMISCTDKKTADFLICLKRYLDMKAHGRTPEETKELLTFLHKAETVEKLYSTLASGKNPLEPYTLHCDEVSCDHCPLGDTCCQPRVLELINLILTKQAELDFDKFSAELRALM